MCCQVDETGRKRGAEGWTGRSLVLVSTFTPDRVLIEESFGSFQVICGCGDCWARQCYLGFRERSKIKV